MPFFAITPVFLRSLWSSYYKREMTLDAPAKFFLSLQHKLFYIVLSLARFNLYALSYGYLFKTAFEPKKARGGRWWWWAEIFALGLFYTWFGSVLKGTGSWKSALTYLLVSHVAASPVHVQVSLRPAAHDAPALRPLTRDLVPSRSCSRTSRARRPTSAPSSPSSRASCARPWT